MMFLPIYVDDMLLDCKDKSQIQAVKRVLKPEFDITIRIKKIYSNYILKI